jgi:hypothetical protein
MSSNNVQMYEWSLTLMLILLYKTIYSQRSYLFFLIKLRDQGDKVLVINSKLYSMD